METKISFGTYNVPSIATNLSATYTAPAILPMSEKANFSQEETKIIADLKSSEFDNNIKVLPSITEAAK